MKLLSKELVELIDNTNEFECEQRKKVLEELEKLNLERDFQLVESAQNFLLLKFLAINILIFNMQFMGGKNGTEKRIKSYYNDILAFLLNRSRTPVSAHNSLNIAYEWESNFKVWRPRKVKNHSYSDGDSVEDEIYRVVESSSDVSLYSAQLTKNCASWASTYHFSPDRHHLIRPLEGLIKNKNVLELGCGCGAISRYLGEIANHLVAVEGSINRGKVAAERCRDLPNVNVVIDLIQDLEFEEEFDVVTLVGVLEYSQIYVDSDDPIGHVIQKAKQYLKPNGILIVAIENQLGLKYFAGAPEDHGVGVMAGINDIYSNDDPITFGKKELENKFISEGFKKVDTFLAFPDYKLPSLIVHPLYTRSPNKFDLSDIVAGTAIHDGQPIANPTFSLESTLRLVERNGLLPDLANSHLFVCHKEQPIFDYKPQVIASYFSPKRNRTTRQYIEFIDNDGTTTVNRTQFDESGSSIVTEEPLVEGSVYRFSLHKIIQKENWKVEELVPWFKVWLDELRKFQLNENLIANKVSQLPGKYLDALPRNMMVNANNDIEFIDLEWNYPNDVPYNLVAFRGIVVTLGGITSVAQPKDAPFVSRINLVKYLLRELSISVDINQFQGVFREINSYFSASFNTGSLNENASLEEFINLPHFTVRGYKEEQQIRLAELCLYWAEEPNAFSEEKTVKQSFQASASEQIFNIQIPHKRINSLRLDISNREGMFFLGECKIQAKDGSVVWDLNIEQPNYSGVGEMEFLSFQGGKQIAIKSTGNDPKFTLDLSNVEEEVFNAGAVLLLRMSSFF
ncbi:class I SAM-dependent methyltransferase [Alteromonas sp. 009811495]|uniref:class I SAM-dependent methyltransferase n=1 Tax=Alteromonas sp. 009811495 TaxID=3002962 RepID=UPI00237DBFC0|nr:class I SAM-dependent methyltransferase [Alteromonas sp. 009811495]WDT85607.1 class I SAM-dependent methyltransferase [Alteromonas sp. 009811495]